MERVMLLFPSDVLDALDARAKRLGRKRSQLIRDAVGGWLQAQEEAEYEALLAAGYQEMAGQLAALAGEVALFQAEVAERVWRWDE